MWQEKLRAYYEAKGADTVTKDEEGSIKEIQHVRMETKTEVETKYIPRTVLSNVSAINVIPLLVSCH
jgi:hypothetical protein